MIGMMREAGQAGAAYNDARNTVLRAIEAGTDPVLQALATRGLVSLAGQIQNGADGAEDENAPAALATGAEGEGVGT
jgi:hypothetical protein